MVLVARSADVRAAAGVHAADLVASGGMEKAYADDLVPRGTVGEAIVDEWQMRDSQIVFLPKIKRVKLSGNGAVVASTGL
jgi:hypothetical protein